MKRAIVIGAGPAGLATAIALRRAQIEPAVFERAGELHEVGSGLTLWPNAMKALDEIGVAEAVRAVCLPLDGIAMRSWRGTDLDVTPGEAMARRYGGTGAALHRSELIGALKRQLGEATITLGATCVGYRAEHGGVTALFADGREERGDLLIGADGLRSAVARQLLGDQPLRYAGFAVWRAVTTFDLGQRIGTTSLGPGAQFGLFPMTGGRVYWFASRNAPEGSRIGDHPHRQELLARFGAWHTPIAAVIEATDPSAIIATDIYDREPKWNWSRGSVTLVGDAAHPSTPNLGQGACQAIEDAAVLARCLRDQPDIVLALHTYETRRAPRANALTLQARRMAQLGTWESRLACWIRDRIIQLMPAVVQRRQLDWLFHFEG